MKAKNLSIGIDLGGTKVATGLVDHRGRLLVEERRPSKHPEHAALKARQQIRFLIDSMADSVLAILETRPGTSLRQKCAAIRGLGLAAAGPLQVEKGLLVHPANFQGWGLVPIVELLREALEKRGVRLKICFQNDAMAAALGEGWIGRAQGATSYAMITLGTGIGTGVIFNGRPAQSQGMGSEWGHIIIDRSEMADDPKNIYHATVEGMASGTGMLRLAHQKGLSVESMIDLADLARQGHPEALTIFEKASHALAMLFYNLAIGFHVDKFCVTGGLLPIRDLFLPKAIELYKQMIRDTFPEFRAPVVISKVGNKAGVIGAARLAFL